MFVYLNEIENYEEEMLKKRQYLHQHPEVSFKEYETVAYIIDFLKSLKHVEIIQPTETSVIAKFITSESGPKIGLRADTDALPIQENRPDLSFQSKNAGVMHACGHDAHTAILMTACQWFDDHFELLKGEVHCIFQHAEEVPPGGAQTIMDTGLLDDLDFVYGQHVSSDIEVGLLDIKAGPATSNTDEYHLSIQGKGGHSSTPQVAINPVSIASKVVQAFDALPAQTVSPLDNAVVANTYIDAGDSVSLNIIPDTIKMGGCVRTFKDEVADLLQKNMEVTVKGLCEASGASYEFDFVKGCKSVINDQSKTAFVKNIANSLYPNKVVSLPPSMGGEDFEVYSRKIPSTFIWIGARNSEKNMIYPHHHPKFAIDESSFLMGLKMLITVVLEYEKS